VCCFDEGNQRDQKENKLLLQKQIVHSQHQNKKDKRGKTATAFNNFDRCIVRRILSYRKETVYCTQKERVSGEINSA
jgi:hypothetical protein